MYQKSKCLWKTRFNLVLMRMNDLIIELHVPDFDKAIEFYSKLGFEVIYKEPLGEKLGYIVIRKGETLLNFYGGDERIANHSFFKRFPKGTASGYGVEITIPIENIDEYYNKVYPLVKDSIVQELQLKPWGKKDFRVIDPFGFYVRFTEPLNYI